MERRRFIELITAGSVGALSGCVAELDAPVAGTSTERTTPTVDPSDNSLAAQGLPATICQEEINEDPGIYAITEPAFGRDWSNLEVDRRYRIDEDEPGLVADQTVIGVTDGEVDRAYPVSVLWIHEIVNDSLGDPDNGSPSPIVVTFCPLCRSGMVASRVLDGAATTFAVTGLLWQAPRIQEVAAEMDDRVFGAESAGGEEQSVRHSSNLVMYDFATRSYWSQIIATAICGPLEGETLDIVPSTVSSWGAWRRDHPDGEVLLPPPRSKTTLDSS